MHDIKRTASTDSAKLGLEIKDIFLTLAHSRKIYPIINGL
jgi:hypothetical protein